MKFNHPIGNPAYGPLLIRLSLGLYFFSAGWIKLGMIDAFVKNVRSYAILPDHLATVYGILLPYLEVIFGALLIVGLCTTLAAGIISLLLVSFIIALGAVSGETKIFNKDFILLAGSLSLILTGPGAFSFDKGKK